MRVVMMTSKPGLLELKREIERLQRGRQTVLKQVSRGNVTQAEADVEFTVIDREQEHWEKELTNLVTLNTDNDALWHRFWSQFKSIDKLYNWNFMTVTPKQKKELLSLVLDSFVLYKDGKIELRFKASMSETKVVESIHSIQELMTDNIVS